MTQEVEALWLLNLVQAGENEGIQFLSGFVFGLLDTNTWLGKSGGGGAICRIKSACEFIKFHLWFSLSS